MSQFLKFHLILHGSSYVMQREKDLDYIRGKKPSDE